MKIETETPIRADVAKSLPESFMEKFRNAFLGDDIDGFMQIIDKDAIWNFMPTGEQFSGLEQIKLLSEMAVADRTHTKKLHLEFENIFSTADWLCVEYIHRGVVPELGTDIGEPKPGTEFAVPICITMHVKNGKFDKFNEYMDFSSLSGVKRKLFSYSKPKFENIANNAVYQS